jgi:hypothetical protein
LENVEEIKIPGLNDRKQNSMEETLSQENDLSPNRILKLIEEENKNKST